MPSQVFEIKSKQNGKYLDVSNEGTHHLTLWNHHGQLNQQFIITQVGVEVTIQCKKSMKYLGVKDNSTDKGELIWETNSPNQIGQKFRIQQTSPNSDQFLIYTFCGLVLDISGGSNDNGAKVIQYEYHGGKNQRWKLKLK